MSLCRTSDFPKFERLIVHMTGGGFRATFLLTGEENGRKNSDPIHKNVTFVAMNTNRIPDHENNKERLGE